MQGQRTLSSPKGWRRKLLAAIREECSYGEKFIFKTFSYPSKNYKGSLTSHTSVLIISSAVVTSLELTSSTCSLLAVTLHSASAVATSFQPVDCVNISIYNLMTCVISTPGP